MTTTIEHIMKKATDQGPTYSAGFLFEFSKRAASDAPSC